MGEMLRTWLYVLIFCVVSAAIISIVTKRISPPVPARAPASLPAPATVPTSLPE